MMWVKFWAWMNEDMEKKYPNLTTTMTILFISFGLAFPFMAFGIILGQVTK